MLNEVIFISLLGHFISPTVSFYKLFIAYDCIYLVSNSALSANIERWRLYMIPLSIRIWNSCRSVELEYYWIIDRPIHIHAENNILSNKALDNIKHSPVFEIIPSNGKLAPMDTSTFNILFKPAEVRSDFIVICFLIQCLNLFAKLQMSWVKKR